MNTFPYSLLLTLMIIFPAQTVASDAIHFGRLFSTSAQRQALDQMRENNGPDSTSAQHVGVVEAPLQTNNNAARTLTVQGVITRRNGSSVAWIDDRRWDSANQIHSGFSLITAPNAPTHILLQKLGQSHQTRLKPGQTLLHDSGTVIELFEKANLVTGPLATPKNKP